MFWLQEILLFNIRGNYIYLNQTKIWDSYPDTWIRVLPSSFDPTRPEPTMATPIGQRDDCFGGAMSGPPEQDVLGSGVPAGGTVSSRFLSCGEGHQEGSHKTDLQNEPQVALRRPPLLASAWNATWAPDLRLRGGIWWSLTVTSISP